MKLLIINGPNLNLLGQREKGIYGEQTFESYLDELKTRFPDVTLDYYQSNIEGELVDKLHAAQEAYDGVVMNAGAYTHTSIAICRRHRRNPHPGRRGAHFLHPRPRRVPPRFADRPQMQRIGDGFRTRLLPAGDTRLPELTVPDDSFSI